MVSSVAVVLYRALFRSARKIPRNSSLIVSRPLSITDVTKWQHLGSNLWGGYANGLLPQACLEHRPPDPIMSRNEVLSLIKLSFQRDVSASKTELLNQGFEGLRLLESLLRLNETSSITNTDGIRIAALSQYHSFPNGHAFLYKIRIDNKTERPVKLLGRRIVCFSETNEILANVSALGDGVVGQQPTLQPNEAFEYCSYVPLLVSQAHMSATYQFQVLNSENSYLIAHVGRLPLRSNMDED